MDWHGLIHMTHRSSEVQRKRTETCEAMGEGGSGHGHMEWRTKDNQREGGVLVPHGSWCHWRCSKNKEMAWPVHRCNSLQQAAAAGGA
jgi:hypothetical protein